MCVSGRQRRGGDFSTSLANSSYLAGGACILTKATIFCGHLAEGRELAHVLGHHMDGQTLAAEVGVGLGHCVLCPSGVKATLQKGRALSGGGRVTGVGAGALPAAVPAAAAPALPV